MKLINTTQDRPEEATLDAPKLHHKRNTNPHSKDKLSYWKLRVRKRTQKMGGESVEGSFYCVQISHKGTRKWFNTYKADKEEAAKAARTFYLHLINHGWDETLEKFDRMPSKIIEHPTVGCYLEQVSRSDIKANTLANYSRRFRTLVSEIMKIPSDRKHDQKNGGYQKWLQSVNSVRLESINAKNIQNWKNGRIQKTKNVLEAVSARRTVDCILLCTKALFREKFRKHTDINFQEPFFWEEIELFNEKPTKFQSKIKDLDQFMKCAYEELFVSNTDFEKIVQRDGIEQKSIKDLIHRRESFKVLILAFATGLRRKEIDILLWDQVNFHNKTIQIYPTEHGRLKSSFSRRTIRMSEDLVESLIQLRGNSPFVIESKVKPAYRINYCHYRCDSHFRFLLKWLRQKGISSFKGIHEFRKECGSEINKEYGISAARNFLGHSSLQTTLTYYTDDRGDHVIREIPALKSLRMKKNELSLGHNLVNELISVKYK